MLFWRAGSRPAPSIDNNPRPAGFQESSASVSEHSLKRFWQHRVEWAESCLRVRRKGTLAHEKAVPRQAQNWGQAAPHAHKNRSLPKMGRSVRQATSRVDRRSEEHTSELQSRENL